MPLSETDIISRYFQQSGLCADPARDPFVPLGIGDDCALLSVPAGQQLAVSMDTLVLGVHFPAGGDPALIAQRALAVNLSDLAAMGASPIGFTLSLTMPEADAQWLDGFAAGLKQSAQRYACPLIGGNLAKGLLQICIQVHGLVPAGEALLRSGARAGDDVYVSGATGLAGLALRLVRGELRELETAQREALLQAYYRPEPRLALGQALRGVANAAQDVSDGLLKDLGHIARASGVGMSLQLEAIPLAGLLTALESREYALALALMAGDDYELVFTAAPGRRVDLAAIAATTGVTLTRIGQVRAEAGVELVGADGVPLQVSNTGYEHFGNA